MVQSIEYGSPDIEEADVVSCSAEDGIVIQRGHRDIHVRHTGLRDYAEWVKRNGKYLPDGWGECADLLLASIDTE